MLGNATLVAGRGQVTRALWEGDTGPLEGGNDPGNQILKVSLQRDNRPGLWNRLSWVSLTQLFSVVTIRFCQVAGPLPKCEADSWTGDDSPHPQRHGKGEGPSERNGNSAYRPGGGNRGSGSELFQ